MWLAETEGVKFWFSVLTDLKNRELQDIQIACVDGLKGFLEAIAAAFLKRRLNCVSCTWFATC